MTKYSKVNKIVQEDYSDYFGEKTLNLGCAGTLHEGMINADLHHKAADICFDARQKWPFDNSLDAVYASHILEHFSGDEVLDVFWHMGNAMKMGGHLIAVVPHGMNELHFANPFHKQAWTLSTLGHFDRRFHEDDGMNQDKLLHSWTTIEALYRFADNIPKELGFAEKFQLALERINAVVEFFFVMKLEEK